jgi:hypothetical protein
MYGVSGAHDVGVGLFWTLCPRLRSVLSRLCGVAGGSDDARNAVADVEGYLVSLAGGRRTKHGRGEGGGRPRRRRRHGGRFGVPPPAGEGLVRAVRKSPLLPPEDREEEQDGDVPDGVPGKGVPDPPRGVGPVCALSLHCGKRPRGLRGRVREQGRCRRMTGWKVQRLPPDIAPLGVSVPWTQIVLLQATAATAVAAAAEAAAATKGAGATEAAAGATEEAVAEAAAARQQQRCHGRGSGRRGGRGTATTAVAAATEAGAATKGAGATEGARRQQRGM